MELHSYDRKTNFQVDQEILLLDKEIKKSKVQNYILSIQNTISSESQRFLMGILTDIDNYDPINEIYILDLMYICCYITSEDFVKEFDVQLGDMKTGFCEQGRTIRLIQLIRAFC